MRAAPAGPGALSMVLRGQARAGLREGWTRESLARREGWLRGVLYYASTGVLFEVWLWLPERRRGSRATFLQESTEVAVTSRA